MRNPRSSEQTVPASNVFTKGLRGDRLVMRKMGGQTQESSETRDINCGDDSVTGM